MTVDIFDSPHRRFNPLTGEWVLVSPHRMKRPWQGRHETKMDSKTLSYDPSCYLCPNNKRSNGEINPDYSGPWVFTNDFPALLPDVVTSRKADRLFITESTQGICRVVCFSPDHSRTLADMSPEEIVSVVEIWQDEFRNLSSKPGIRNIQIFENKGEILGCSNPHPHGQIWAESTIPVEISKRVKNQQSYFTENGNTLLSDYLAQERETGERIICGNEHFTALVPFWAVWPYETMIRAHRPVKFVTELHDEEKLAFAGILSEMTIRYDNLFQTSFPYSAGMQNAPVNTPAVDGWHFHFSFYPPLLRSATVRKFMVGYEMFANPQRDFTPEYAASILRELPAVHYNRSSM